MDLCCLYWSVSVCGFLVVFIGLFVCVDLCCLYWYVSVCGFLVVFVSLFLCVGFWLSLLVCFCEGICGCLYCVLKLFLMPVSVCVVVSFSLFVFAAVSRPCLHGASCLLSAFLRSLLIYPDISCVCLVSCHLYSLSFFFSLCVCLCLSVCLSVYLSVTYTHTHARTHARTHTHYCFSLCFFVCLSPHSIAPSPPPTHTRMRARTASVFLSVSIFFFIPALFCTFDTPAVIRYTQQLNTIGDVTLRREYIGGTDTECALMYSEWLTNMTNVWIAEWSTVIRRIYAVFVLMYTEWLTMYLHRLCTDVYWVTNDVFTPLVYWCMLSDWRCIYTACVLMYAEWLTMYLHRLCIDVCWVTSDVFTRIVYWCMLND